ncbi:caprin-2 isoform X2 [Petromyzon marinus]|uniref:caprin-2 isoform X2 n=1 Tax=Petromyzon marinus TaxID=7757 RepID=UPI003F71F0C1
MIVPKPTMQEKQSATERRGIRTLTGVYESYIDNVMVYLKHKIRNLEKRKGKLDGYRERLDSDEKLNLDQQEAVNSYQEVIGNLEFAQDVQKTFTTLNQEFQKSQRKAAHCKLLLQEESEKRRLRTVVELQYVLEHLGNKNVRRDFTRGLHGAAMLAPVELKALDDMYSLIHPNREKDISFDTQMKNASIHLWEFLEGKESVSDDAHNVQEVVSKVIKCGYFDKIPEYIPESSEEESEKTPVKNNDKVNKRIHPLTPPPTPVAKSIGLNIPTHVTASPKAVKTREFVNRQYVSEVQVSQSSEVLPSLQFESLEQRLPKRERSLATLAKESGLLLPPQPKKIAVPVKKLEIQISAPVLEIPVLNGPLELPDATLDPKTKRQRLLDLIAQMQGTFSFMQESLIEAESDQERGAETSPVLSHQCMAAQGIALPNVTATAGAAEEKPASLDIVQPLSPEKEMCLPFALSNHSSSNSSSPTMEMENHGSPLPVTQNYDSENIFHSTPNPSRPVSPNSNVDLTEVNAAPVEERERESPASASSRHSSPKSQGYPSPAPSPLPKAVGSSVRISTDMSANAVPFTSMHSVFNMSNSLQSQSEMEAEDQTQSQPTFSTSYNPGYLQPQPVTSAQLLQPSPMQPVGSYGSQVELVQPPPLPFQQVAATQTPFPGKTIGQSYYPSRGMSRGVRGGRAPTGGYRGSHAMYRGMENYRTVYQALPNGIYMQPTFPAREYTGMSYRDGYGYQHGYRRVASAMHGGFRSGWSDSSQQSSPERVSGTFNSNDSGRGDSRSVTPVDVQVVGQPATIMPVNMYPLPQQTVRVAFSAARTVNFTPGILDQPIVFDLIISNLGEAFDVTTGRFLCPSNGTYVFIFHILKLAVNVPLYINLMRNDEVLVSAYANDGAPDHETASNHAVLQLVTGDNIWLRVHRGTIYGSSWKYSTFSGYLLYLD